MRRTRKRIGRESSLTINNSGELTYMDHTGKIDALRTEIDRYRPISQEVVKQLHDYYRIGLTYTSNAIEGNTLTESETKVVIEDGITVGGKTVREHEEAIGHARAYDVLQQFLEREIAETDILQLHRLFFSGIDPERAGKYRAENVIITGTDFLPPDYGQVPGLMMEHIGRINRGPGESHPVLWAADIHAEFESIHPFMDGNGRIGRLILSLLTIRHGYCPVIIPPVRRTEYIAAMRRANKGELQPIRELVASVVYEEMKAYRNILTHLTK